ncbi:MAG: CBS domain-containing protein [Betaproteobacteria bacterium]|nr:CBS domain-containing protein [Betaproteobacteria bacterium]
MQVNDYMSHPAVTIRSDADYKQGLQLMQDRGLHHVPVLDRSDKLTGIVAERDLLLAALRYLNASVEVGEIMHRDVVTATTDMPLTEAASLMSRRNIGGLPVVDGNGRVVGVITETDIFKAFVELLQQGQVIPSPGSH